MNTPEYLLWLLLPALAVWAVTVTDMATRPGLSPVTRAVWIVATTFLFPVALLWYLVRPVADHDAVRLDRPDPRDPLAVVAAAVDARSRGALGESAYHAALDQAFAGGGEDRS